MEDIAKTSQALSEFQIAAQKYYTCYSIASIGLKTFLDKILTLGPDRSTRFIVGRGHPDLGHWRASVNMGDFIDSSQNDGGFARMIAKSFVILIYTEWDEYFRKRVGTEARVNYKSVKSDLMGDLRLIRHCIIHNKSVITEKYTRLKELKWVMEPGDLEIDADMFSSLIDQINQMKVRIES